MRDERFEEFSSTRLHCRSGLSEKEGRGGGGETKRGRTGEGTSEERSKIGEKEREMKSEMSDEG